MAFSDTLTPVTHYQGCSDLHSVVGFAWTSKGIRVLRLKVLLGVHAATHAFPADVY